MRTSLPAIMGILILLALWGRIEVSARYELAQADRSLREGDPQGELLHLRRGAHWYLPYGGAGERALRRLVDLGQRAQEKGDRALAQEAYWSARGAILASRGLWAPHTDLLASLDQGLSALEPAVPLLMAEPGPHALWSLALVAGFLLFLAGAFRLAARRPPLAINALSLALGLALWVAGSLMA